MSKQMKTNNSRSNYSKQSNQNGVKKPFCKVCFDAKKPKEIYESHWVKDREGNVTCITLNEQECRYCYKSGHTVKFCEALARANKDKERVAKNEEQQARKEKEQKQQKKSSIVTTQQKFGAFAAAFYENEESDDETKTTTKTKQVVEEWPQLCFGELKDKRALKESRPVKSISFADAIKKTKEDHAKEITEKAEKTKEERWTQLSKTNGKTQIVKAVATATEKATAQEKAEEKAKIIAPPLKITQRTKKYISWADAESSDEEDDEEENYPPLPAKHPEAFLKASSGPMSYVQRVNGAFEIANEMQILSGDSQACYFDDETW